MAIAQKIEKLIAVSVMLLLFTITLTDCASGTDTDDNNAATGGLSFSVHESLAAKITGSESTARSADLSSFYMDISLHGDYEATKTIPVRAGATTTFTGLPIGSVVYAIVEAYATSGSERTVVYSGQSEDITLQEGTNSIVLNLQALHPVIENISDYITELNEAKLQAYEGLLQTGTIANNYQDLLGKVIYFKTSNGAYGAMSFTSVNSPSISFIWKLAGSSLRTKSSFQTGWGFDLDGSTTSDANKDFGLDNISGSCAFVAYNNAKFYIVN